MKKKSPEAILYGFVLKDQISTKFFNTSHGTLVITECFYREINNVYSVIFIIGSKMKSFMY